MTVFAICHSLNTGSAKAPVRWQLWRATAATESNPPDKNSTPFAQTVAGNPPTATAQADFAADPARPIPPQQQPAETSGHAARPARSKIPLLALHGFGGEANDFRWLAAECADLFDVYALDFLGHGGSDAPRDPLHYRPAPTARAIGEALRFIAQENGEKSGAARDHFSNLNPPILLGYSMGGRMALRYLARCGAEGIRGLVLIGASDGLADAALRRERRAADRALAQSIIRDGTQAFTKRWNAVPLIASQRNSPYFAALQASRLRNNALGLANSLRGIGTGAVAPVGNRLAEITAPCLLVTGESDAKFAAIARRMAQQLPNAVHCEIPAAGHAAHWENPQAFYAVLRHWAHAIIGAV